MVTTLPDRTVAAQLDESYMETMIVTRAADGSLEFGHATGLENAARVVKAANARSGASAKRSAKKAAASKGAAASRIW